MVGLDPTAAAWIRDAKTHAVRLDLDLFKSGVHIKLNVTHHRILYEPAGCGAQMLADHLKPEGQRHPMKEERAFHAEKRSPPRAKSCHGSAEAVQKRAWLRTGGIMKVNLGCAGNNTDRNARAFEQRSQIQRRCARADDGDIFTSKTANGSMLRTVSDSFLAANRKG